MKRMPCIRGLDTFKKGCPKRPWDAETGEGCPAWIEMPVATKGNPLQKETKRQCLDLWNFELKWSGLGVLEGVQSATESNRNITAMSAMVFSGAENPGQLMKVASKALLEQSPCREKE